LLGFNFRDYSLSNFIYALIKNVKNAHPITHLKEEEFAHNVQLDMKYKTKDALNHVEMEE